MKRAYNNNYSVLPFYKSVDTQYPNLSYSFGDIFPLYIDKFHRPTFQIYEEEGELPAYTDIAIYLMDKNGTEIRSVSFNNDLAIKSASVGHYFVNYGTIEYSNPLPIGQYYFKLVDSKNGFTYFSEFITIVNSVEAYLKLEWRNESNFETDSATILYDSRFRNLLYLPVELGKPEYQFDEEGETRDGHFFPIKQVSYKTYKASFLAPEFLLDAMRLIRLADQVKITEQNGNEIYADTFLITPKWEEQGNLASVTMEITTDSVAKKCGRAVSAITPLTLSDEEL